MTTYYLPSADGVGERPQARVLQPVRERAHAAGGEPSRRTRPVRAVLRRRSLSVLFGCAGVIATVAAVTFLLPPRYESTASFLIEEASPAATGSAVLSVLERLGHSRSAETEIALLRSHSVVAPVADLLDLHVTARTAEGTVRPDAVLAGFAAAADARPGRYALLPLAHDSLDLQAPDGSPMRRVPGGAAVDVSGLTFEAPRAAGGPIELEVIAFGRAVERVQRRLRVQPADANAEVILLTCEARTAGDAQRLCSELSDSYLRLRSTLQRAEANAAASFLAEQVTEVGAQLTAAEEQMRRYALATRAVALQVRAQGEVGRFIDVKAQREGLAAELVALQSVIAEVEGGPASAVDYRRLASFPTFMKSQNQVVTQLLESLVQLENRRSDLALRRSEQNPDLTAVNQRIAEIQAQLRSIAGTYQQGLAAQIASLDESLGRAGRELEAIPTQEVEYARLRRQVTLLEELYHFLQTRLHEAEVAQAVNLPSVRVVDRATLPFRPASPNVPLNLGLAAVLGVGFGLMLGLYREYSDTRIYERQEVEHGLGIPVVGMVARLDEPGPIAALPVSGNGASHALVRGARHRQQELAWEAYHGLAIDLRFARAGSVEGKPHSVAVTSASRGEGKTLTACNLAIAWASYPARTLIIDADLRAGAVSRFFGLAGRAPGLSEVLSGAVAAEQAIRRVEPVPGVEVAVLAAGSYPERSGELFDTAALDALLRWAESQYDLVVVDTPPLNVLSDAAAIAARVDSVLVVVRGGSTDRMALDLTLRRLARAGGHVEGIVLNDVDLPDYYVRYSKLAV
jgi:capsular exopolysaccharide synthesis family protein